MLFKGDVTDHPLNLRRYSGHSSHELPLVSAPFTDVPLPGRVQVRVGAGTRHRDKPGNLNLHGTHVQQDSHKQCASIFWNSAVYSYDIWIF
jgi:hypothetical protein